MFTGGYEIILFYKKPGRLHHGLILTLKLLQAFTTMSLRRMSITSMI
jgi:hypothetical protein